MKRLKKRGKTGLERKEVKNMIQAKALNKIINVTNHDEEIIHFIIQGTPQEKVYAGFSPEMTMGSMTKGPKHIVTLYSDEKELLSWYWGLGGHTLVTDKTSKLGKELLNLFKENYKFEMGR